MKLPRVLLATFLLFVSACTNDFLVAYKTEEFIVKEEVKEEFVGELGWEYGIAQEQAVDITFFVDESGSMYDDQAELSTYMPDIYTTLMGPTFTDLKWCVQLATTDSTRGVLGNVCWDDPDAYLKLLTLTSLLNANGYLEAGLDSAVSALAWSGAYRKEADWLIVYISDEPDQSSISIPTYENIMDVAKEDPFIVTEAAIILTGEEWDIRDSYGYTLCTDYVGNSNVGTGYLDVAETVIHLCDSGWDRSLDLVKDHVPSLNERWFLDDGVPYADVDLGIRHEDSIKVWLNDTPSTDWFYDINTNEVILATIPEVGTAVAILYLIKPA